MTDHFAPVAEATPPPGARLEPEAIGAGQDTIIGMASSAPAATVGLSLAALAVATASSIVVGLLIVILSAVYYIGTSVQNAFFDVIDVTGLLFSIFYILTALAAMVYYRRRIVSGAFEFVTVGLLPLSAAGFLGWIFVKSLGEALWSQHWSLIGIVIAGLVLMVSARFVLRSPFFSLPRESEVIE